MIKLSDDSTDCIFRTLFCLIFLGLGAEHLFSDQLIQNLMPGWLPWKRTVSVFCGFWLIVWGSLILVGGLVRWAARAGGAFLIIGTFAVHLPGAFIYPATLPEESRWMWDILQRSNLVKNFCLLGVCFLLLNYEVGKYSFDGIIKAVRTKLKM